MVIMEVVFTNGSRALFQESNFDIAEEKSVALTECVPDQISEINFYDRVVVR